MTSSPMQLRSSCYKEETLNGLLTIISATDLDCRHNCLTTLIEESFPDLNFKIVAFLEI